jgi:hypothetical protein
MVSICEAAGPPAERRKAVTSEPWIAASTTSE